MFHGGKTSRRLNVEHLESRLALATFFVSPTGDNANDGTSAPWLTLQHAANRVQAGDTVIVRSGTYAGFDLWTDGAAGNRITFRADPGTLINAPNSRTGDGINLEGADYVTIEGFTVRGVPRAGIRSVVNEHVVIRNNHTDLNGVWGIFSGFSDDLLVEGNIATRSQAEHGIYVSNSGDRPVIHGNTIWGNRAAGIHMNGDLSAGGDGIISGALVEANVIYENGVGGGSGINADGVQSSVVRNNLIYNNHASGISLYRIDGAAGSSNNLVINNTIVQAADGRWALNIQVGSTGNTVLNNILYNKHSFRGSIDISGDSLAGFRSDYNVVMNRFTTNGGSSVMTLAQWQSATGQDQHSLVAAPSELFVDPAANDYHLSATSPAVDAGTSEQAPPSDFEGTVRPGGSGIDIGADERVAATPVNRPPQAVDDAVVLVEDATRDIAVLANDSDPDGNALTVATFTQPQHGSVVLLADGRLRYQPHADFSGSDSFTYQASDGTATSNVATVSITVTAGNDAPVIEGVGGSIVYRERSAPVVVAPGATVTDGDSANFASGTLTVRLSAGAESKDRLSILAVGGVTATRGTVRVDGVAIGTFQGGRGATPLTIALTSAATPDRVQRVIRSVAFENTSKNPSNDPRTVSFTLSDGDGGTSPAAMAQIEVVGVNDAPQLIGEATVGYTLNAAPIRPAASASLVDPDSRDFGGGLFYAEVVEGADPENRLEVGGPFTVSNGEVLYQGLVVGEILSSGVGASALRIALTDEARIGLVQGLLRTLRFRTVNGDSIAPRTIAIRVSDGDGGVSNTLRVTVNVL